MRRLNPPTAHHEDGAVAVMVALLMIPLIGFAAYAVDVAALYHERRQLQNGADAAALATAADCGRSMLPCSVITEQSVAQQYADANAIDNTSAVEQFSVDLASQTVTVATRSRTSSGDSGVRNVFATVFGRDNSPVRARAKARWDVPVSGVSAFPLAFCIGEFNARTAGGTVFGPPAYPVIYQLPGGTKPACALDPTAGPNTTYPGGYGWLQGDASCRVSAQSGWAPGDTGSALPSNSWGDICADYLRQVIIATNNDSSTPPLLIPVFDNYRGQGSSGELHLAGFGAFRPTGYRFSGTHSYPNTLVCGSPSTRCITGWFTKFVTSAADGSLSGKSYGLTTVRLVP